MERRTPNKRKALANSNTTPNKIKKTKTPLSQSPKFVSKNNQIQNNGNQFKSIGNQKTTPKKQIKGIQTTPKGNMKSKQLEEDDEIESDNSMDEADSDEKLEIDEADSDDELEINEDNSDEEVECDNSLDEAVSDEKLEIDEADSDDELEINEDNSDEEVEPGEEAQVDEDEDAVSDEEAQVDDKEANSDEDEEADSNENEEAVSKEDEADNDDDINVIDTPDIFSVFVDGFDAELSTAKRIFPGCKIQSVMNWIDPRTNTFTNWGRVIFEDEESMKKALAKSEVKLDGKIIKVHNDKVNANLTKNINMAKANNINTEYCVSVKGIYQDAEVQDLFNNCKIISFKLMKNIKDEPSGVAFLYFEDQKSMMKALSKNGTEFDGRKITLEIHGTKNYTAKVSGLKPYVDVKYMFQDSIIKSVQIVTDKNTERPTGNAIITFPDLKSFQIALMKNGRKFDDRIIRVRPSGEFEVKGTVIGGVSSDSKIWDIFKDCNILVCYRGTEKFKAIVYFQDEESVQKALLKNGIKHDGSVIKVHRKDCCIIVRGIKADTEIKKIFTDCNIHSIELKMKHGTNELAGAFVSFKDFVSFQKARSIKMPPGTSAQKFYDNFAEVDLNSNNNAPSNSYIGHAKSQEARSINMPPGRSARKNNINSQIKPSLDAKLILLEHLKAEAHKLEQEIRRTK